jgi:regulator of protease activity HflC (stomatin/prohibitin superfamily)
MELEVFLQYQVQPEHIIEIATQYGNLDALQARIETQTIEKTKAVMSSDIAMNIIQNRARFSNDVSEAVREGISADYYVNVKDVVLTNIDFTDEFEKSVEDKVIAEQQKQAAITRAEAELEVAKLEAQKKIEEARGNAEAQKIIAQAAAEAATYKIIELARVLGYDVEETYIYSVDGIETEFSTRQEETDTVIYLGTKYVIDITSGPGAADFKTLVEDYLKYLAYLENWNGELPDVVAGDDAISIIVPQ